MSKRSNIIALIATVFIVCSAAAVENPESVRKQPRKVPSRLYANKVDTLTLIERFSLGTNVIDWTCLTPNFDVEFMLGNKNWQRWSIGLAARWNPSAKVNEPAYQVYDIRDIRGSLRYYWHGRGLRRSYYLGAYVGTGNYDIKLGKTGNKGNLTVAGLSFGTVAPLYGYANGSHLDLVLGANAGIVLSKTDKYRRVNNDGNYAYVTTEQAEKRRLTWNPASYIAATDVLRVAFVYHFGAPVADRYKRRIVVDERYKLYLNEQEIKKDSTRLAHHVRDSIRKDSLEKIDYERRFEQQRLELDRKYVRDSLRRAKTEILSQ